MRLQRPALMALAATFALLAMASSTPANGQSVALRGVIRGGVDIVAPSPFALPSTQVSGTGEAIYLSRFRLATNHTYVSPDPSTGLPRTFGGMMTLTTAN